MELPQGEAALEAWLSGRGKALTLNKDNGTSIQTLGQKFRAAIERESRDVFFKANKGYLIPGFILRLQQGVVEGKCVDVGGRRIIK